jgi:hypothetical protein
MDITPFRVQYVVSRDAHFSTILYHPGLQQNDDDDNNQYYQ